MGIKNETNVGFTESANQGLTIVGTPASLLPATYIASIQTDNPLGSVTTVQSVFPAAYDVWTLAAATTYYMDGQYILNTGTTSHTTAMSFATSGTITNIQYTVLMWTAAANTIATAQSTIHISTNASTILNAAANPAYTIITFSGTLRMNAGGTITPQITFGAAPGGTNLAKVGTWIRFTPIGSGTFTSIGPVA
jgi:hypothetical protein